MSLAIKSKKSGLFLTLSLLASFFTSSAYGAPLDDLNVQQVGDEAQATIKLTTPVHFLRYVPSSKSRLLEIYYERMPSTNANDPWVEREVLKAGETAVSPSFTVTTRDQVTQPKLVIEFSREVESKVSPAPDGRSFLITIKSDQVQPSAVSAPTGALPLLPTVLPPVADTSLTGEEAANAAKNTQDAFKLMTEGRDALAAKNHAAATDAFNKLLLLPPNQYSRDAQEWIGVSRERDGQAAKAKVEYELYLKLFSTTEGAPRVRQRLAGLVIAPVGTKMDTSVKKIAERSFAQGGISSHYYFGNSVIDATYILNRESRTTSYSFQDQSSLITDVNAIQRYVSQTYDNRIVFRDTHTKNMLPGKADRNRMNAAYIEVKNREADYSARLGRQNSNGGGVMGRFDGVAGGVGSAQEFRLNGVAGQLVDFTSTVQPVFYGVSVDSGPYTAYLINQTIDGVLDRRALGMEYRYFNNGTSAFALLDYDIYFAMLNAATLTGSYVTESTGTTFNFMADYRRSPNVSIRNALNGANVTSVKDLLLNDERLKELAILRTGNVASTQFGISQKLNTSWQVSTDFRLSRVDGMVASGNCSSTTVSCTDPTGYHAATDATGVDKTITAQMIGSNLYSDADMTSYGLSYVKNDYVTSGQTLFVYNRTSWDNEWFLDLSWSYSKFTYTAGYESTNNMPMTRVTYQMNPTVSFDADLGIQLSSFTASDRTDKTRRIFGSLGFRWDF